VNTATVWDKLGKSAQYPCMTWEVTENGDLVIGSPGQTHGFAKGEWTRFSFDVKGIR
jgi:hypothetical protein